MKKNGIILSAVLAVTMICAKQVQAQEEGKFGLGIVAGDPTGLTGKYWIDGTHAFDFTLGFSDDFEFNADYLWHGWGALPQPSEGKLAGYLGLGGGLDNNHHDSEFAIRTVAGAAYWFPRNPVEIFLELAPMFIVSPDSGLGWNGGIGIRVYFNNFN